MNIDQLIALQPALTGAIGGAISSGLLKGPIKTVEDYWSIFVGSYAEEKLLKIKAKQEHNLQLYRDELASSISKIEPDDFQDPQINILGPALEASRYYIDEEEMRKMFANLLASSMDKSKNNIIHNSFVEIIKQLSPLDAKNLLSFQQQTPSPVVRLDTIRKNRKAKTHALSNIYWLTSNQEEFDVERSRIISSSLDNLQRLGLISMGYESHLIAEDSYSELEKLPLYKEFVNAYIDFNNSDNAQNNPDLQIANHEIIRGIIDLTDFGKSFCKSCIY